MLLGKGGSDMSCPAWVTVCFVSIFSHLFLSSNTTVRRPTITSPLRSLCWLLSSSGLSLTAFLPQHGSVWPSLCLYWREGRLQRDIIIPPVRPPPTQCYLPSFCPDFSSSLPSLLQSASTPTSVCCLQFVIYVNTKYWNIFKVRIPHPNSFPSSIIMRGSRTVISFITIWRHSWAPAPSQLCVIFLLFLLTFFRSGIFIGVQVISILQNKQISTVESALHSTLHSVWYQAALRCLRLRSVLSIFM